MREGNARGGFVRTLLKVLLVPACLAILACVAAIVVAFTLDAAPERVDPEETFAFQISEGDSVSSVGERLERQGIVRSALYFKLMAKVRGIEGGIQKGYYSIGAKLSSNDILGLFHSGDQELVRVTIPEGATMREVARLVAEAGVATREDFLAACRDIELLRSVGVSEDSAEGYLFPETYLFQREYGGAKTVRTMTRMCFDYIASVMPEGAAKASIRDTVILASIVEREYRRAEEAPRIASVFLNRLAIGMRLQSCATVVYIMTEREGKPHPSRLFENDLLVDDPYNTYLYEGLPLGPISNPGKVALNAAFNPEKTDYLYFVLVDEGSGSHYFSRSYDEHLAAKGLSVKHR